MGRPRTISRALPKWCSRFTDRHGKPRYRLRRTGYRTQMVDAEPGSARFTEIYHQWLEDGALACAASPDIVPQSFDDLIARFYRSPRFTRLSPSTQATYRGELERFRALFGARSAITMRARHIETLMAKMSARPAAANNLKKRLGQLFDFCILLGWRSDNPARAVAALPTRSEGFKTWHEAEIARFEAHHALGTRARLAFDLALYTAQRRSDLCRMGPQHIENGKIRVRQLKTGKTLLIPIHPRLAQSIEAARQSGVARGHLAFVTSPRGAALTKESFGNWFRTCCREAGIEEGYSLHGLRKAASRRMAEVGLSNQLIKAITGHTTDSEVSRYTREAEQERMAELAMAHLANLGQTSLANPTK